MRLFGLGFNSIEAFFLKGHERSLNIKKNIVAIFIIRAFSIIITLVLVPITIDYLNPNRYGIWLTLSSIVAWISYFDVGFGNGLRNKFAEAVARSDFELARTYVSTTYAIIGLIFGFFWLVFISINSQLNWTRILNAPIAFEKELSLLALITVTFFCFQMILQLISTIVYARQQPAISALISLFGHVLSFLIIFTLTKTTSGNLIFAGLALSSTPVFVFIFASIYLFSKNYKVFKPSLKYVNFTFAPSLIKLGFKFFFLQIATLFIFQASNLIIAQIFGPEQVTSYNVAYRYFGLIPMAMSIIMMPLWSSFTDAWVKKDFPWIIGTMKKLKIVWISLSVLSVLMLIFSDWVYRIWVGENVKIPFSVSFVICIFVIIAAGNMIFTIFLNGVGKINLQVLLSLFVMLLFIPTSVFFGKNLGLYGVIVPAIFLNGVMLIVFIIQYKKIISFKASGIWGR